MTVKEKAKELVDKFKPHVIFTLTDGTISDYIRQQSQKQCALIAVEEIISNIKEWDFTNDNSEHHFWFWSNVKEEIDKLV